METRGEVRNKVTLFVSAHRSFMEQFSRVSEHKTVLVSASEFNDRETILRRNETELIRAVFVRLANEIYVRRI